MFDNNPVLKERVMGLTAIVATGVGGLMAVDLMITGGFDFSPARAPVAQERPAYVRVVQAAQTFSDRFRSISWDQPIFDEAAAVTTEDLAGADNGAPPVDAFEATSGDDLYAEISALYAEDEPYAETPSYEDAAATDAYADEATYEQDYGSEDKGVY